MKLTILLLAAAIGLLLPSCASKSPIDQARGMNSPRSVESMYYSDQIQNLSRGVPYDETCPYVPYRVIAGGSPACVQHYTGHARRYDYRYKKTPYHFTVRELAFADGSGCHQGHNPPLGFYEHMGTAKVTAW